jgi:hypothetical protein
MNDLELEPLPDDVLAALDAAGPVAPLSAAAAATVLAKVKVSAGLIAAATAAGAATSGATSAGATSAGATGATSAGATSAGATSAGATSAGATSAGATSAGATSAGATGATAATGGATSAAAVAATTSASIPTTGAVATKVGASLLLKLLPVVTLTAGIGLGVAADRLVLRPNVVKERVVVERVEVPVRVEEPKPAPPPRAVATKKPTAQPDSLGRERVLLDLARSALSSGDVGKALAAVQSHESQFATGQLVEEREALAVQILWSAGRRDEATRRLHAFILQFPDSPLRPALDSMMSRGR